MHTTEGLLCYLLCLRLQSSLSQHRVAKSMADNNLEGKVWCGVPLG